MTDGYYIGTKEDIDSYIALVEASITGVYAEVRWADHIENKESGLIAVAKHKDFTSESLTHQHELDSSWTM